MVVERDGKAAGAGLRANCHDGQNEGSRQWFVGRTLLHWFVGERQQTMICGQMVVRRNDKTAGAGFLLWANSYWMIWKGGWRWCVIELFNKMVRLWTLVCSGGIFVERNDRAMRDSF